MINPFLWESRIQLRASSNRALYQLGEQPCELFQSLTPNIKLIILLPHSWSKVRRWYFSYSADFYFFYLPIL